MTTEELTILIQSLQEQIKQGQEIENEVWFLIRFYKNDLGIYDTK